MKGKQNEGGKRRTKGGAGVRKCEPVFFFCRPLLLKKTKGWAEASQGSDPSFKERERASADNPNSKREKKRARTVVL